MIIMVILGMKDNIAKNYPKHSYKIAKTENNTNNFN